MQPSRAIEESTLLQSTNLFVFPLQDITAEDWKDAMEWLHLRHEKSGTMEYNARPCQREVYQQEFQTAHLNFGKDERPDYPSLPIKAPSVIR